MKEFQEYTGRDLYDYCCGYILKRESIWNGSAVQYSDQIEKKIKGVLKRRKAGSYNADRRLTYYDLWLICTPSSIKWLTVRILFAFQVRQYR